MRTRTILCLTLLAAGIAAASPMSASTISAGRVSESAQQPAGPEAQRDTGGMLRTLEHGTWRCALPGDATGAAW